jgi:hypothetical protein
VKDDRAPQKENYGSRHRGLRSALCKRERDLKELLEHSLVVQGEKGVPRERAGLGFLHRALSGTSA